MRIAITDKDGKCQSIDTEYDIGDTVTVLDSKTGIELMDYRPLLCDLVKDRYPLSEPYPVQVPIRYTISDIEVSAGAGVVRYNLHYSNDGLLFPSGSRSVAEKDIALKLDSNDYEIDPAVKKWCKELKDKILENEKRTLEDPMYYTISTPEPRNRNTGNRSLSKRDYDERKKDWVITWGKEPRIYKLDKDWVVAHAKCPRGYTEEETPFMLLSEADIEKYIRENCLSNPLF